MKRTLYKQLWSLRFEKMLALEEGAVIDYGELLEECRKKHANHPIEVHLEELIRDEKKHVRLVKELLDILHLQSE